jgi:hypothetical protein
MDLPKRFEIIVLLIASSIVFFLQLGTNPFDLQSTLICEKRQWGVKGKEGKKNGGG